MWQKFLKWLSGECFLDCEMAETIARAQEYNRGFEDGYNQRSAEVDGEQLILNPKSKDEQECD